jgi:coniferyl-aldehyde dehydrogenase
MRRAPLLRETEPLKGCEEVLSAFERLSRGYRAEPYPTAEVREDRLDRLLLALQQSREEVATAVSEDFGQRCLLETLASDVLVTVETIRDARRNVRRWMARRPVAPSWYARPASAWVEPQPLGVVGIISPWNYPVALALAPAAAALAAGNRVLLKPSEHTPRTSALLGRILRERFLADELEVVEGGPDVARAVCELPLGHLFFTGSTAVGRLVAQAAAKNLVPVTLELGGKSPALMHPDYDLDAFADRVAFGKLFNGGQTCIAPDYALVPEGREESFARAFLSAVRRALDGTGGAPADTSLASERGLARMRELLTDATRKGAKVVEAGVAGEQTSCCRFMAPVVVLGVTEQMRLAEEEIFGPILPVWTYRTLDEAIDFINARPRPLALYYFDRDEARIADVLRRTCSGGACVNETLFHYAQESLPFGGVGPSGVGRYKGQSGFDTLSNLKGVFAQSRLSLVQRLVQPPYPPPVRRLLEVLIGGRARRAGEL